MAAKGKGEPVAAFDSKAKGGRGAVEAGGGDSSPSDPIVRVVTLRFALFVEVD
jgi:hypothetical protein